MAVAVVRKKSQSPERPTLSPEKGSEILGILLLAAGIFLVLSLGTHHPQDPSLLHRVPEDGAHAHNWIGSVGAHISALLTERLESRLNLPGTLVVLGVAVSCGLALVVQSTLGDILASWRDRLKAVWQNGVLARERRHERREKERNRRRVITKHLQR